MLGLMTGKNTSLNSPQVYGQTNNLMPIILIVDDDEDSRQMLQFLLGTWSFRVIEATDGIEAVSVAEKENPDLILMDVKLPNLDGFGAARRIRESEKTRDVPIIFLSGCAEEFYKNAGNAAGGNEYLVKPLDFEELEKTLGKYIRRSQASSTEKSPIYNWIF